MTCKYYLKHMLLHCIDAVGELFDFGTGDKDRCSVFNDIQVLCEAGICQNYSAIYK